PDSSCGIRLEPSAEVLTPALGKRVVLGGTPHRLDVVAVEGVQPCDLCHAEAAGVALELDDLVAGPDLTLPCDGQIEAEQAALEKLGHELVAIHTDPELEARKARLGDDELGGADTESVAHVDLAVEQALGGQVVSERAGAELELRPLARPELVGLGRGGVDGLVRAAVNAQVGRAVAVGVEPVDRYPPGDRLLPDSGCDRFAPPERLARETDVDRHDLHRALPTSSPAPATCSAWKRLMCATISFSESSTAKCPLSSMCSSA